MEKKPLPPSLCEPRYHIGTIVNYSDHRGKDVQALVREGSVAVDAAVDRVKEHGEAAGKVLAGDVEKAKKAGKKKVTRSFITPQFSAIARGVHGQGGGA